ncbi:MAG TPA: 30S ribosomal protein S7 [Patescibacteria group bacterium]
MSRKGPAKIRILQPDPVFGSLTVEKLVNGAMKDGRKSAARKQVYLAMEVLKKEVKENDALTTLEAALDNIKPKVEVRPRRIGGAVYQVPTPVKGARQLSLALRWLVDSSRKRPSSQFHTYGEKLAAELLAALKNEGSSVSKRMEVERMAEANKAFAHLRW